MEPRDALPRVGQNVILRRLRADDLRAFQAYRHDPDVGRLQGWVPVPDNEADAFLISMGRARLFVPDQWNQIGIAETSSDLLIGDIGIVVRPAKNSAEIGISLRAESQGRGLGREVLKMAIAMVFEHVPVGSLQAITDQRNTSAIKLLENVGMTPIATQVAEFRGLPCAEITYSISRPADAILQGTI